MGGSCPCPSALAGRAGTCLCCQPPPHPQRPPSTPAGSDSSRQGTTVTLSDWASGGSLGLPGPPQTRPPAARPLAHVAPGPGGEPPALGAPTPGRPVRGNGGSVRGPLAPASQDLTLL